MVSVCRSDEDVRRGGLLSADKHQFIEGKEREKPEQHPIQACHLTIIYSTRKKYFISS